MKRARTAKVTRRNDTPQKRSILLRARHSADGGLTAQVIIIFGCVWLVGFLGVIAWYLGRHRSRDGEVMGVHALVGGNRAAFQPFPKKKVTEEPTDPPGPQTGVKHVPNLLPLSDDPDAYRSPLIIFTCQRPKYLSQTLDDILENIGDHCAFGCPVVVSEDGDHNPILATIKEYSAKFKAKGIPLIHMQHDRKKPPDKKHGNVRKKKVSPVSAYRALAQHYGWAITQVFDGLDPSLPAAERIIILEEDIHTAPDFFSFMKATSRILDEDSTLFAVSAYNDNGHKVKDPHRILRSDFFPGLGWMMTRKLWKEELEVKWPLAYWDDWLREPAQRKNRHILRPEVSRTFHFGEKGGTSRNQFGSILSRVKLNNETIDWTQQDLSYLHESTFDEHYAKLLFQASVAKTIEGALAQVQTKDTRKVYHNLQEFKAYAAKLDIMDDEKANIPRTAYKGVVEIRPNGTHMLFLTPPADKLKKAFPGMLS